jgi:hypothetical protein
MSQLATQQKRRYWRLLVRPVLRHDRAVYGRAEYQVLREGRRRARGFPRGRIHLNALGWLALIILGSAVSMAAAAAVPIIYAVALGVAAALLAYGVEYYFTVRESRRSTGGPPGADGDASGDREPRRPQSPPSTLAASRPVDKQR